MLLWFTACGYKPIAHYSPKTLGENVYTEVIVSLSDPENAVLIKDALNKALLLRLKSKASRQSTASSQIIVAYDNIQFLPLQYDKNGYIAYYQANVRLGFTFIKGKHIEKRHIVGRYEFPIQPSAIISNNLRFKAIERGSIKALDQFIAYISVKGYVEDE